MTTRVTNWSRRSKVEMLRQGLHDWYHFELLVLSRWQNWKSHDLKCQTFVQSPDKNARWRSVIFEIPSAPSLRLFGTDLCPLFHQSAHDIFRTRWGTFHTALNTQTSLLKNKITFNGPVHCFCGGSVRVLSSKFPRLLQHYLASVTMSATRGFLWKSLSQTLYACLNWMIPSSATPGHPGQLSVPAGHYRFCCCQRNRLTSARFTTRINAMRRALATYGHLTHQ